MDQDEETCADSTTVLCTKGADALAVGGALQCDVLHEAVGRKRLRPPDFQVQDVIKQEESAEVLEEAISRSQAKADQIRAEADRLHRSAEVLTTKLEAAR